MEETSSHPTPVAFLGHGRLHTRVDQLVLDYFHSYILPSLSFTEERCKRKDFRLSQRLYTLSVGNRKV